MKTLGIDLASQPAGTAVAGIEWPEDGPPRLMPFAESETEKSKSYDDPRLIELLRSEEWGRIAVDVPFGWPRKLLNLLQRWRTGEPVSLPVEERRGRSTTLYRETDLAVWTETGVKPIPVGVEKLAWVALRSFHLLSQAGFHADHAGLRAHVIETYPKAALTRWRGMPTGSTKSRDDAPAVREHVLQLLAAELSLEIAPDDQEVLIEKGKDHRFDALICALVARAAMLAQTDLPNDSQREAAQEEGWIHLPSANSSLADLARPRFLDVEMPQRFVLETLEPNEEWIVWGDYTADIFQRFSDGAYGCGSPHGGSPTWIRCVRQEGERLHVIDGGGRPYVYRLRAV